MSTKLEQEGQHTQSPGCWPASLSGRSSSRRASLYSGLCRHNTLMLHRKSRTQTGLDLRQPRDPLAGCTLNSLFLVSYWLLFEPLKECSSKEGHTQPANPNSIWGLAKPGAPIVSSRPIDICICTSALQSRRSIRGMQLVSVKASRQIRVRRHCEVRDSCIPHQSRPAERSSFDGAVVDA